MMLIVFTVHLEISLVIICLCYVELLRCCLGILLNSIGVWKVFVNRIENRSYNSDFARRENRKLQIHIKT